jgi:hypothetical protein
MKKTEFTKLIDSFQRDTMPGKQAFVWHGDKDSLLSAISKIIPTVVINLLSDLNLRSTTTNSDEKTFSVYIQEALEKKLIGLYQEVASLQSNQILIILNSQILARYKIGLVTFYDYYLGDRTKIVFVVPKSQNILALNLPEYVQYEPNKTIDYLAKLTQNQQIIE